MSNRYTTPPGCSSRRAISEPTDQGGWNAFHTWWTGADILNPVANIGVSGGCRERAWFGWPCDEEIEKLKADNYIIGGDPTLYAGPRPEE